MFRTVLSFASGFVVAKLTANSKTAEKVKDITVENFEKVKSTSKKIVEVVKDEFSSKEIETGDEVQNQA